ncbi:MAG TPA: FimV/HubP family polar landmark protein [Ramlibacter sp.]|nr:FimV/HubP family polar landmark protein [Ramlibacter sp.]
MQKPHWRATALAIGAAALFGLSASDASALGLGRITVQSALGEPLRAEIDIPEINAEELATLRTTVASPDAFRAAGLEYNPAVSSIRITLERRADGRHFLRLASTRPVSDPFVDLILETQWSAGRIVRDYTMLFDPPNLRPAPPVQAQVTPAAPAAPAARTAPGTPPPAVAGRAPGARPTAPATTAEARPPSAPRPAGDGKQVTVQPGDTAGKIAAANKTANISLDQMLVALLRANPDAFVGGNVNRLRAGAVLDVPSSEDAGLVPSGEARQTLVAQSRDFNEFRRKLAEGVPTSRTPTSDRQAAGKVTAQVEEKKPGAAAPDKLTLSKGAVAAKGAEDQIARDRAAKDAAARVAELNKNIADLNKLGVTAPGATGAASAARPGVTVPVGAASVARPASAPAAAAAPVMPAASAARPASAPAVVVAPAASAAKPAASAPAVVAMAPAPAPAVVTPALPASAPAAMAPASAAVATAALPASAPATPAASGPATVPPIAPASAAAPVAKPPPVAAKPPAAPVETSLVDDMMENPIVPATLGGVLALLLGFGIYRAQQRKKSTQVDSSFLESRLQPDSFFGASGGQRVDTNEGGATGSSMVYSPSQLDAAGDVDPVAEADVYLAYGRDLQAEEILKEAMRTTPQRVAIHSKLLEIYSKRRDAKAFELVATEAYGLTHGEGPEWEHISELGQELDPSNTLYRGGKPVEGAVAAASVATAAGSFGATTITQVPPSQATAGPPPPDVDLDLDFSLDDPVADSQPPSEEQRTQAVPVAETKVPALDMDFGSATVALDTSAAPTLPPSQPEPVRLDAPDLTLNENSLNFSTEPAPPPPAAAPAAAAKPAAAAPDTGMIEFDLGALSLDLGGPVTGSAPQAGAAAKAEDDVPSTQGSPLSSGFADTGGSDPLATKLALAEEFNAIGDPDGARSLAQEVLAEASGDLKSRAQKFLAEIS